MGVGFAPTWLCQVSPLLHKTTLTTDHSLTLCKQLALDKIKGQSEWQLCNAKLLAFSSNL